MTVCESATQSVDAISVVEGASEVRFPPSNNVNLLAPTSHTNLTHTLGTYSSTLRLRDMDPGSWLGPAGRAGVPPARPCSLRPGPARAWTSSQSHSTVLRRTQTTHRHVETSWIMASSTNSLLAPGSESWPCSASLTIRHLWHTSWAITHRRAGSNSFAAASWHSHTHPAGAL